VFVLARTLVTLELVVLFGRRHLDGVSKDQK
jgi:hypothetical protein